MLHQLAHSRVGLKHVTLIGSLTCEAETCYIKSSHSRVRRNMLHQSAHSRVRRKHVRSFGPLTCEEETWYINRPTHVWGGNMLHQSAHSRVRRKHARSFGPLTCEEETCYINRPTHVWGGNMLIGWTIWHHLIHLTSYRILIEKTNVHWKFLALMCSFAVCLELFESAMRFSVFKNLSVAICHLQLRKSLKKAGNRWCYSAAV